MKNAVYPAYYRIDRRDLLSPGRCSQFCRRWREMRADDALYGESPGHGRSPVQRDEHIAVAGELQSRDGWIAIAQSMERGDGAAVLAANRGVADTARPGAAVPCEAPGSAWGAGRGACRGPVHCSNRYRHGNIAACPLKELAFAEHCPATGHAFARPARDSKPKSRYAVKPAATACVRAGRHRLRLQSSRTPCG